MKYRLWVGLMIVVLIASCAAEAEFEPFQNQSLLGLKPEASAETPRIIPSVTLVMGRAATETPAPIGYATATDIPPAATVTRVKCGEPAGSLQEYDVAAVGFSEPLPVIIYLPPCYDPQRAEPYPVVYLLHGQTYTSEQWVRLGIRTEMDRLIADETIVPFVVVMPYETPVYYNLYGVALTRSLLPWVVDNFRVCDSKACRAIGGISRGGGWALYTVFQYPGVFGHLGLHSTPSFDGEHGRIRSALSRMNQSDIPRIMMDIGRSDYWYSYAADLHAFFERYEVDHLWNEFAGKHDEAYWGSHLAEYLVWYGSGFE